MSLPGGSLSLLTERSNNLIYIKCSNYAKGSPISPSAFLALFNITAASLRPKTAFIMYSHSFTVYMLDLWTTIISQFRFRVRLLKTNLIKCLNGCKVSLEWTQMSIVPAETKATFHVFFKLKLCVQPTDIYR